MAEEEGQELVRTSSSTIPGKAIGNNATSTKTKKSVQESLLQFLESKKYGAIYLENNTNNNEDEKTTDGLSIIDPPAPFEIKDKERLSDPYALTAKFTNSSGLPQVVFDEVDYYVPSTSDDMTISEMSSSIATGNTGAKKTFLKGSAARGGDNKSKKSAATGGTSAIADQMKFINSKATGLSGEPKEVKEAKSLYNLGMLYSSPEERKYDKAEEFFCKALNARINVYGKNHAMTAEAHEKLADVLVLLEDSNTARIHYSEALQSCDDDDKEMEQRIRKSLTTMPLSSTRDPTAHQKLWDSIVSQPSTA